MTGNGTARPDSNGKPHRCGENGGVTRDGKPCRHFVSNGGLCSHHADARFTGISHPKKRAFLGALAETGNRGRAVEVADICRQTYRNWRIADDAFAAAFDEALEQAADLLEEEGRRRAFDGLRRLKFHQGVPIINPETGKQYAEIEYSDTLLIFLLKGVMPEKYRERHQVDGNVTLTIADAMSKIRRRREAVLDRD